jgi:hypothetical protein
MGPSGTQSGELAAVAFASSSVQVNRSTGRSERLLKVSQCDGVDIVCQREGLDARVDDEAPCRLDIVGCSVEAAAGRRGAAPLDLYRPTLSLGELEHEVDLGACRASVEESLRGRGCHGKQVFNYPALPAASDDGMADHIIEVGQTQQRVHDAAVADIDLGCADKPLAFVGGPGVEADE